MRYCDGELRGRPTSADEAKRQWQTMAGRAGELHTGHCVIRLRNNEIVHQSAESPVTSVHFAAPSAHELDAYIASGEPLNVAGGFTLDGPVDGFNEPPAEALRLPIVPLLPDRDDYGFHCYRQLASEAGSGNRST